MKKTKTIAGVIVLALAGMSLASCGTRSVTTTTTAIPISLPVIRPEGYHELQIKGADSDISPDFPDKGQYEAGSVLSFKVAIATDVSFAVYLNDVQVKCKSSDESTDGYDYYEIEMPGHDSVLALISSAFSVDKDYSVSDIKPWADLVTKENLVKVKVLFGNDTAPESEFKALESTDSSDLEYNLAFLKNSTLKYNPDYSPVTGGSYVNVTYVLSDGTEYLLSFGSGDGWSTSCTIGEEYYDFVFNGTEDELPKISHPLEA